MGSAMSGEVTRAARSPRDGGRAGRIGLSGRLDPKMPDHLYAAGQGYALSIKVAEAASGIGVGECRTGSPRLEFSSGGRRSWPGSQRSSPGWKRGSRGW
jgi:hypothetical protein